MKIFAIASKEIKAFFRGPMGCIVLTITISIFNVLFYCIVSDNKEATLRDVFQAMEFMFIFIVPLITMRLFAEEKMAGTMEFLLTTPTKTSDFVLGKYLGSLLILVLLISVIPVYFLIMNAYGKVDVMAAWAGFLGIFLEGAFFMALGLLTSAWTRSHVVAALCSYAILFLLYFSMIFASYLPAGFWQDGLKYFSTFSHLENFSIGVISLGDILYYTAGILVCLYLTRYHVDPRVIQKV